MGTLGFLMTLFPDKPRKIAPLSVAVHRFSDKVLTVLQRSGSHVTCCCFLLGELLARREDVHRLDQQRSVSLANCSIGP